jgi:hypothetical protein
MKSLTQIANHLTVYDRNGGVNVPKRWFIQNQTRYLESKTEKLTVPVKGSLTASVKPHACKMYVLTFSPYSHTSPLDSIYDTFGIPLCDKKH